MDINKIYGLQGDACWPKARADMPWQHAGGRHRALSPAACMGSSNAKLEYKEGR